MFRPHRKMGPFDLYTPWLKDEVFMNLYAPLWNRKFTMCGVPRAWTLWETVRQSVLRSKSSLIEIGCCKGGMSVLMSKAAESIGEPRSTYALDSFIGVVNNTPEKDPGYVGGEHPASVEDVEEAIHLFGCKDVYIISGIFPESLNQINADEKFSVIHYDADTYQGFKDTMTYLWPRLDIGGVIIIDDYGRPPVWGVMDAVDEIKLDTRFYFNYNLSIQGIMVKLAD